MPGTHHHSLQHKQVSSLQGDGDSPEAVSPYSRTPALRNSHKIAERKRRTEMKTLFDTLRSQIPASHGSKSSKWEILSKGKFLANFLNNDFESGLTVSQRPITSGTLKAIASKAEMPRLRYSTPATNWSSYDVNWKRYAMRTITFTKKWHTIASKPDHRRLPRCIHNRPYTLRHHQMH